MAQAIDRERFIEKARKDPYASMDEKDREYLTQLEIVPIDATKTDELSNNMSWTEQNLGLSKSVVCITDYGRHRDENDTMADFREFVKDKIRDSIGSQYLKVMDDEKERVAETLLAISRSNGYIVVPHFED